MPPDVVPLYMMPLEEVPPDEKVLLEGVVHPNKVPVDMVPLEEEVPPDVVLLQEVVHPDEVLPPRGG